MQARATRPRNPFRFGALAKDDDFADREKELATLVADAENGQDVVVFAPRRLGKSSLISAAMRQLVQNDVLVADIDLWKIPTKERLAEALASAIYTDIARLRDRAAEKAAAIFRGLRVTPAMTIDPETGRLTFSFSTAASSPDIDATIERLLELPAELGAEQEKSVVLVLDEFQEVGKIGGDLTKLMRSVFQHQSEVSHVYLGSRRHLMEQIFNDEQEPFWRSAKQMELGPIPRGEFSGFIAKRFADTGKKIEQDVVDKVLDQTDGHPYATQRLCYEVWQATGDGATAGEPEFDAAFRSVLESENSHFALIWGDAATAQQQLLSALAVEPGRPLRSDYRARHGLPTASTIQRAMQTLKNDELIGNGRDEDYRITEPFLAAWIRSTVLG